MLNLFKYLLYDLIFYLLYNFHLHYRENYKNFIESKIEIESIVEICFHDNITLDEQQFIDIIEKVRSEIFIIVSNTIVKI